ncbi:sigma-70 family RNA polymerase sigma factor [Aporhodopirellula aestuarii]|uniref:Sigma-70 family RNA polymerase sigma factor n=1 Tax=Aporhodopirellula aestuarii TaxID=2950107 RepID=A0ABT0UCL5_9BACT|nr:sigma-70 family RNA polymerase sigma factor [Aporhodopirellula aestuarii]MCM2374767.1 sigma-70 family RNA polymerase sigma factor [Aporhodopirellula aestuarii]
MSEELSRRVSEQLPEDDSSRSPVVKHLVLAQPRLFAYALTLLPSLDAAYEVLQEANCKLLENADKFEANREFLPWACGVIRNEVLARYRDHSRDRHVFSIEFISRIAEYAQSHHEDELTRSALRVCYERLTDRQRMLVDLRYGPQGSVAKMAMQLGRPAASISTSLNRIRRILEECIGRTLGAHEYE